MELSIKEESLSKSSVIFLLVLAFVQGMAGFFLHVSDLYKSPQIAFILSFVVVYIPLVIYVTYRRSIATKTYWINVLLFSITIIWVAWYIGSEAAEKFRISSVFNNGRVFNFFSFGHFVAFSCFCFIALFFFKSSLHEKQFPPSYRSQFGFSWHNYLSLKLSFIFIGILFGILKLWGALFKVVNIDFFDDLFDSEWFLYPMMSIAFAYAMIMFRTQINAVGAVQRILRALFKLLLPLLVAIAVMFISVLPFTGISTIWDKNFGGSATLLGFSMLTLFFFNAVYQDGIDTPYREKTSKIIRYATLVIIVFSALSLYGISTRVSQYGLSPDRIWALILAWLTIAYLIAYSVISFFNKEKWPELFGKINSYLAIVIASVCLLLFTPVLNVYKLSADSQYQRFIDNQVPVEQIDFHNLARLGNYGLDKLDLIKSHDRIKGNDKYIAMIDMAIENKNRRYFNANNYSSNEDIAAKILVHPKGVEVKEKFWVTLKHYNIKYCSSKRPCFLILIDLNDDGKDEYVYLSTSPHQYRLRIYGLNEDGTFSYITEKTYGIKNLPIEKLKEAIENNNVGTKPSKWQDLEVGGVRIPFFRNEF